MQLECNSTPKRQNVEEKFIYLDLVYTGRPTRQYMNYPICLAKGVDNVWDVKMSRLDTITFASARRSFTLHKIELSQIFDNNKTTGFAFKNCSLEKTNDHVSTWRVKQGGRKRRKEATIRQDILWNGF